MFRVVLIAGIGLTLSLGPADAATQRGPSARYCAAEAGQGSYPPGCPRPVRRPPPPRGSPPVRGALLNQRQVIDLLQNKVLCEGFDQRTFSCLSTTELANARPAGRGQYLTLRWAMVYRVTLDGAAIREYQIPFSPVARIAWRDVEYELAGGQLCTRALLTVYNRVAHIDASGTRAYLPSALLPAWRERANMGSTQAYRYCTRFERGRNPLIIFQQFTDAREEYRLIDRAAAARLRLRDGDGQPH